jgi:hypothetical protein
MSFVQTHFNDVDEGEWSNWAFAHTDLTFLRFPGLVSGQYHLSLPNVGTFSIENGGYWAAWNWVTESSQGLVRAALLHLMKERAKVPRKALFSALGEERTVRLYKGTYDGFLWFPQKYSVHFVAPRELVMPD